VKGEQLTAESVALADWLVGPFEYEQRESSELSEWQLPFYKVAIDGVKRICGVGPNDPLPEDFQPDPLKSVELYRELAADRKSHGMINSLHSYITDYKTGVLETRLRDHQREIMDVLAEQIATVGAERQINIKSPTGTGKTAILTTLIEGLKYKEQPNDKVRALVLLPSKSVLSQTVKAFRNFTGIEAAMYFGESQEIGDVTAMTYQSFKKAIERGDIDRESFDVVVRDEADTFSRSATGELIDSYCYDPHTGRKKLVVGLTATPHEEQEVAYERTVVESIKDGLLAPLTTYQRHTRATVHEDADRDWRDDFKDSEVGHLMEDTERNEMIVEEVLTGLASGRRVMVRCVPGRDFTHPKIIKRMLEDAQSVRIKHPYMGDVVRRPVRAVIIPGSMSMRHRELLTGVFNNHLDDRIDVLLFIGTLIRGFDSPVAKKVINAAPTRSLALAEQLLGRVERWFETYKGNVMDAQAVDIVDHTDSGQITFEEIINRDAPPGMRYRRGAIIGPGLVDLTEMRSSEGSAFEPISLDLLASASQILLGNGFSEFSGVDLRTTRPEQLHGRKAAEVIGSAALLETAKQIPLDQLHGNARLARVSVERAAETLDVTPATVMLTAYDLRIGLETVYDSEGIAPIEHFFTRKGFERLQASLRKTSVG
jgi:superfamily II DNA or RNA helicase